MNLLIESKKKNDALKFLPKLNSELMKVAKTGIIKKQTASRSKFKSVRMVFTIFLITRPFQLVVYIVWPGESESAVQNNQILQPKEKK